MTRRVLLASHGSVGGIAAEQAAIEDCKCGDELDHLYVVPSWWRDMTGDDWLNNGVSRNRFRDYLQQQLWQESCENCWRIERQCVQIGIIYKSLLCVGESEKMLQQTIEQSHYNKIYVGDRRPKGSAGLRDRMLTNQFRSDTQINLHIIPHPDERVAT